MSFNLATVMDAIGTEIPADIPNTRIYAWPVGQPTPPCVIVDYPAPLDFDVTFHPLNTTGKVTATFPVWYLVAQVSDKAARDALSALVTGAPGVKESLDGNLAGACDTCRVTNAEFGQLMYNGVPYVGAHFTLEVIA